MDRALLDRVLDGAPLDEDEAGGLLRALIDPDTTDLQRAAALGALRARGETAAEVRGLAMAMRAEAVGVTAPRGAVDTCGTGGDGSGSFNVSTTAALLVAAAGVPVVKHGNRSVSSKCGSADVLEALGVRLAETPQEAAEQLDATGFTFLFAPNFHPATAAVGPVRRALGVRTVFNLLGPLTNPAGLRYQLVGAWSEPAARLLAEALSGMPIDHCIVVHGAPSWDEATPCGPFLRLDVTPRQVVERVVDPVATYGVVEADPADLAGGDADHNARLVQEVFSGGRGALRDAVLINAALVLELVGAAEGPEDAVRRLADVIDQGRATWFLERLATR